MFRDDRLYLLLTKITFMKPFFLAVLVLATLSVTAQDQEKPYRLVSKYVVYH